MKSCYFLIVILAILACAKEDHPIEELEILVLGHIYSWGQDGNKIDERLESVNYDRFEEIWLLGDVCSATTRERSTLVYIDGIFDLADNNTKWAVGNHDVRNGNIEWIEEMTGRELYYSDFKDSYASFVLNTQMELEQFRDSCDYKEKQHDAFIDFLEEVKKRDSIHTVFILTHNAVWSDAESRLREYNLIGNASSAWYDFLCKWAAEFRNLYFDHLLEIQYSGKQVHCVAGDGGQYDKAFYDFGESGIKYYVSGINNSVIDHSDEATIQKFNTDPDSVLIFRQDIMNNSFIGEFIPLDNL